ncbi:MAG: hypothetical protein F6K47_43290 [Symploca sp. SIO2E6]|nr:hypothetical protein [Symploca sp. SIO2E6]
MAVIHYAFTLNSASVASQLIELGTPEPNKALLEKAQQIFREPTATASIFLNALRADNDWFEADPEALDLHLELRYWVLAILADYIQTAPSLSHLVSSGYYVVETSLKALGQETLARNVVYGDKPESLFASFGFNSPSVTGWELPSQLGWLSSERRYELLAQLAEVKSQLINSEAVPNNLLSHSHTLSTPIKAMINDAFTDLDSMLNFKPTEDLLLVIDC